MAADEPLADVIDQVGGFADNARTAGITVNDGHAITKISIGDTAFHEPLPNNATIDVPAAPQVTVGGIDTRDLQSKSMEARNVPGLYFIGEAVDVTGWLGGYNFQWAWSSGWAAGSAA